MMRSRLGSFSVVDPLVGPLELESDGFGAGDEPLKLALQPAVQRYLALAPEEVREVERIWREYTDSLEQMYAADAEQPAPEQNPAVTLAKKRAEADIARLLNGPRGRSLRALSWRLRGGEALLDVDVAAALQLSPEQRAELARIASENDEEFARRLEELKAARVLPEHHRAIVAAHRRDSSERLLTVLTPEQRDRYLSLQSE